MNSQKERLMWQELDKLVNSSLESRFFCPDKPSDGTAAQTAAKAS
jgi:hypothetical protein